MEGRGAVRVSCKVEVSNKTQEGSLDTTLPSVWKLPWKLTYISLIRLGASGDTEQVPPIRLGNPLEAKTRSYPSHRKSPELGIIAPIRLKILIKSRILCPCLSLGSLPGPCIQIASLNPSLLDFKVYPKPMPGLERGWDGAKGEMTHVFRSTHAFLNFAVTLVHRKQQ